MLLARIHALVNVVLDYKEANETCAHMRSGQAAVAFVGDATLLEALSMGSCIHALTHREKSYIECPGSGGGET
jgi:hypothetical protein